MKCPKCGRGIYEVDGVFFCRDLTCEWHSKNPTYQQRLDNVLKHFKHRDEFYCDLYLYMDLCLYYDYGSKIFLLNDCAEISIHTVESLLKDLGVM